MKQRHCILFMCFDILESQQLKKQKKQKKGGESYFCLGLLDALCTRRRMVEVTAEFLLEQLST